MMIWGMVAGWAAKLVGLRSAAGRWVNPDALKALGVGLAAVVVIAGITAVWFAVSGGATAKADRKWLSGLREMSVRNAREQADEASRIAAAADMARTKAEAEREAALMAVADLEQQLAALKDKSGDPVAFPKSLARSLNR